MKGSGTADQDNQPAGLGNDPMQEGDENNIQHWGWGWGLHTYLHTYIHMYTNYTNKGALILPSQQQIRTH